MRRTLSPLRYPGGKTKLFKYTRKLIEYNNIVGCSYVEPFAGGCGLALELLHAKVVDNIILNDIDKSIYSFWKGVLDYKEELVERINAIDITVDEWHVQKEIQENKVQADVFDLAFSTLFLNRTNRSGILNAGPIGGYNQSGNYKIDCRFNKSNIIYKLNLINSYREKMQFFNLDAIDFLTELKMINPNDVFIFFDPPYYVKGSGLYTNFYKKEDHQILANKIKELNYNWIVTYDNVEEIKEIYQDFAQQEYSIDYSANKSYKGSEIMVYSNDIEYVSFK